MPQCLLLLVVLLIPGFLYAGNYDLASSASLKQLAPLVVVVECGPELIDAGLVCTTIESDTREVLQKAHIALQEHPQPGKEPPPFLALRLSSARLVQNHTIQIYGVTLRLDIIQGVHLPRTPSIAIPASTWNVSRTEILGSGRLIDIRKDAAALVDEFVARYAAAQSLN